MAKRYDQFCPIAHALSLVGERWSLLVVRELLKGPRRYTDLAGGLPGIGTNILATRLRDLEAGGVVRKRKLPPPVASTVYELTEYGAGLEEAIHAIARWGARSLGPPDSVEVVDPEWGLDAFPALLYPERARGLTETYVIGVDASTFTVRLEDGGLAVELGDRQIHLVGDEVVQSQDEVRRLAHSAPVDPAAFDELVALPRFAGRQADQKRDDDAENDPVSLHQLVRNASTIRSHLPCARSTNSMNSRTAPRPPGYALTQ